MRHYFWLEQLNICAKYWFFSDKCIHFAGQCCANPYWPTDVVHSLTAVGVSKLFVLVYHLQDWLMLSFPSHLTSTTKAKTSLKLRAVPSWTKLRPLEIRVSKKYRNSENIRNNFFCVWCFCQKFSFHWCHKITAWRNKKACLQKGYLMHRSYIYHL